MGFAEFLAAAPAALERWRRGRAGEHPAGGAIISAAVDARRAGHLSPLSRDLLEALYRNYLDPRDVKREDAATFTDGIGWAIEKIQGAARCLAPAGEDQFEPLDYLVDHAQQLASDVPPIPPVVWQTLVDGRIPLPDMMTFAERAHSAGQHGVAEDTYRQALNANSNHAAAMYHLGILLQEDRPAEAKKWLHKAASSDHQDATIALANLLMREDCRMDAEQLYRKAAEAGHNDAMYHLGILLQEDRPPEAKDWLHKAANSGHKDAMVALGNLLESENDVKGAERWYLGAAYAGHNHAMYCLAKLYALASLMGVEGARGEADKWYHKAADAGHNDAMIYLGNLLESRGDMKAAKEWFHRAAEAGHNHAMYRLANLLEEQGNIQEAEQWYIKAANLKHVDAMRRLADMLQSRGDYTEAAKWRSRIWAL